MSFSETGTTKEEIKEYLGQQGLKALKVLSQKNILSKNEGGFYKVAERNKDSILPFDLVKSHVMFLAEQYKPNNVTDNYIHYWVESLNQTAKMELMKAHEEFHNKVRKIMDDKNNKGNELVFSVSCSDTLL